MFLLIVTVVGGIGLAALLAFTLGGVLFRPDEMSEDVKSKHPPNPPAGGRSITPRK